MVGGDRTIEFACVKLGLNATMEASEGHFWMWYGLRKTDVPLKINVSNNGVNKARSPLPVFAALANPPFDVSNSYFVRIASLGIVYPLAISTLFVM